MASYRLINEQYAHAGPIRCVSMGPLGETVSGSQADAPSVRRWMIKDRSVFEEIGEQLFHDHWITAITCLSPGIHQVFPEGCIITGCMDNKIRLFDPVGNPLLEITGHNKGVISFSWTNTGNLISGSWDGTARIWEFQLSSLSNSITSNCLYILGPHENGVHVLGMKDGRIITTSTGESVNEKPANFQIRVWNGMTGQQILPNIQDHSGPIRSITSIPGIDGYATSSNDGTVIIRTSDGTLVGTLYHPLQEDGSPPFLFDCTHLYTESGMDLVSCGEDGSVCVWQGTELLQSIPHPNTVWCVLGLPDTDGDFITCSHDGLLRLFSRRSLSPQEEDRIASLQLQFQQQVSESLQRKRSGPSQEEINKATKWEDRGRINVKSEGQVMVFNKDNRLIAAEWSAVSGVWIEVGDVTGSSDNGTIDGVYYDHVMPVEIDGVGGSVMKLELGYNNMENPYEAAQRFIDKNDLPQHHLKQIADWISTKAGKQTPTLGPQGATIQNNSTAIQQSNPKYQYLPLSAYVIFSEVMSGLRSKLIPKITEFNNSQEDISKKLTEPEMHALTDLVRILEETSYYHSSIISGIHLNILYKMITQWNMPHTFPAYDLLRLVCIHAQGSKILSSYPHLFILLDHASNSFSSTESPASSLCASRFIGNSFRYEEMRMAVLKNLSFLQTLIVKMKNVLISSQNKSLRLAASNIALNLSLSCQNIPPGGLISKVNIICGLISAMIECLDDETNASEYISRYLIAIGTSILTQKDSAIIRDLKTFCQSQNLVEKLLLMRQNVAVTNDVNLTKCIEEFTDLISR